MTAVWQRAFLVSLLSLSTIQECFLKNNSMWTAFCFGRCFPPVVDFLFTWNSIRQVYILCISAYYIFRTCQACLSMRNAHGKTALDRLIAKLPDAVMVSEYEISIISAVDTRTRHLQRSRDQDLIDVWSWDRKQDHVETSLSGLAGHPITDHWIRSRQSVMIAWRLEINR